MIITNLPPSTKVQDKVFHVANCSAEEIVNALEITGELFCTTRGKELVLLIGQVCHLGKSHCRGYLNSTPSL
jgi:hypothetical protein